VHRVNKKDGSDRHPSSDDLTIGDFVSRFPSPGKSSKTIILYSERMADSTPAAGSCIPPSDGSAAATTTITTTTTTTAIKLEAALAAEDMVSNVSRA